MSTTVVNCYRDLSLREKFRPSPGIKPRVVTTGDALKPRVETTGDAGETTGGRIRVEASPHGRDLQSKPSVKTTSPYTREKLQQLSTKVTTSHTELPPFAILVNQRISTG